MNTIPVAVQLYTLRNETDKDFIGTLKNVAEMGYDGVEFAGYGNLQPQEVKKVLDDLGLKAASSHVPLSYIKEKMDELIETQVTIGSKHIVCPYLMPEERTEQHYQELISVLNTAGEKCAKNDITLSYHNHDFELQLLSNGKTALQTILEETNPQWVKAELDVYWLTYAGEDPVAWLKKYDSRTPLVHLKDMTTDGNREFAELGTGGVNLESILSQGAQSMVEWWIVEQDVCKQSPLASVKQSLAYLQQRK